MGKTREMAAVAVTAGLIFGAAALAQAYDGGEVKDGGTISGMVKFPGHRPREKRSK